MNVSVSSSDRCTLEQTVCPSIEALVRTTRVGQMADQLAGNAIDVHSSEIVQLGTMTIEYLVAYYDADGNTLAVDYVHEILPSCSRCRAAFFVGDSLVNGSIHPCSRAKLDLLSGKRLRVSVDRRGRIPSIATSGALPTVDRATHRCSGKISVASPAI